MTRKTVVLKDLHPERDAFVAEVHRGLAKDQKTLPCKYFYDHTGSLLFNSICETEEYYPTRTELSIMRLNVEAMAAELGDECLLIEYGSGSGEKVRLLLDQISNPAGYVPIDISKEHLKSVADDLNEAYPHLEVLPVCADFTKKFELPIQARKPLKKIAYFPGSTIGNFEPQDALDFLKNIADLLDSGDGLLIGIDLKKDKGVLEAAYNDKAGLTERFNKNILERINNELDANFSINQFEHSAIYNTELGRMEMHLKSLRGQRVRIDSKEFTFESGETIHTESSHKYDIDQFARMANQAGFYLQKDWVDEQHYFSVLYFSLK
ncbi:MAG: dimethylhistidine N-methyltransferase [Candidatus Omnitrophota bacterium]|jgi:dimethylhistidine N-methyltransferase